VTETVYLNGQLLPREEARISPFDHGFLYGYGLFETLRAYPAPGRGEGRGHLFRLERHLERLHRSAQALGLSGLPPAEELSRAAYAVLHANGLSEARLRITVSLGAGEITPEPPTHATPTVFIAARPFSPPSPRTYEQGYRAIIWEQPLGHPTPLAQHKSLNYLAHLLARRQAKAEAADEALLVNRHGLLVEAATANLFLVAQGQVMTPPPAEGVLPGVTRGTVLELASALGITSQEIALPVEALPSVEEAFLTNSLLGVMPLTRVAGQPIGTGRPGPITRQVMRAYDLLVKRECGAL